METKPLTLSEIIRMHAATKKALRKKQAKVRKIEKLRRENDAMIDELYKLQVRENELCNVFYVAPDIDRV